MLHLEADALVLAADLNPGYRNPVFPDCIKLDFTITGAGIPDPQAPACIITGRSVISEFNITRRRNCRFGGKCSLPALVDIAVSLHQPDIGGFAGSNPDIAMRHILLHPIALALNSVDGVSGHRN